MNEESVIEDLTNLLKTELNVENFTVEKCLKMKNDLDLVVKTIKNENDWNELIESIFTYIEQEIEIRIESIKTDIETFADHLQEELTEQIVNYKKLQNDIGLKIVNAKKDINEFKSDEHSNHFAELFLCKHLLNRINDQKKKLENNFFTLYEPLFGKYIVGKLKTTFYENWNKVVSNKIFSYPDTKIVSLTAIRKESKVLLSNVTKRNITITDTDGKFLKALPLPQDLKPYAINYNNDLNLIFVSDFNSEDVFVFNSKIELINRIPIVSSLVCFLTADKDTKTLYCSCYNSDILDIYEYESGTLIWSEEIEKPGEIRFFNDKVLIVGAVKFSFNEETREADIDSGLNAILIYDKISMEQENMIQIENWFSPLGLEITENQHILTTAREIDIDDRVVSQSRFLFFITFSGELIKKIDLGDTRFLSDMIFVENKLIFCQTEGTMRIIELE